MESSAAQPDSRLVLLLPASFLAALGIGLVNLGMLFLVKQEYGARPAVVGWFAALWSVAYFAGCVGLRPLSRLLSPAASMALASLASALLLGLHLLLPGLASAFAAYTLFGLATSLFWPRLMGWLTSGLEGEALGRASGSFSLAWSSGAVVSPYLAGLLAERSLRLPVYAAIAAFCLNALLIAALARSVPLPAPAEAGLRGPVGDRSTPLRFPAWIGVFLIYAFMAVFFNIFPGYARDELGLTESGVGLVLLCRAAATAFGFWLFGRVHFWHFRPLLIPLGLGLALLLDLSFILVRSPLAFAAGLAVAGLVQADIYSKSIFYGATGAPDRESRVIVHEALLTAGQILGSVLGGVLYQEFSWPAVFAGIGAMMAAGLAAQAILLRRRA